MLSSEQLSVVDYVNQGRNVLLTGPAGTGKTMTLMHIINGADERGIHIGVTAMTGAAAYLLGGRTLHSFLGIGLAKKSPQELARQLKIKFAPKCKTIRLLDLLLIDEVSMMNDKLLELISEYLSLVRNDPNPFGGLQLLLCADFAQLPPISGKYAFLSPLWPELSLETIVLTKVFRQNEDLEFATMLNRLRWGGCTAEDFATLVARKDVTFGANVTPTRLYSRNADVDRVNKEAFDRLVETHVPRTYYTVYGASPSKTKHSMFYGDSCGIPSEVVLCLGAQVVVTANVDAAKGVLNGTRGVITFMRREGVEIERVNGDRVVVGYMETSADDDPSIRVKHMPLKLAYAVSIHKSQGMTLDCVEMDLGNSVFEYGQAYTALSRARSLNSVKIVDVSKRAFKAHDEVLKFYGM
jgi:ATP-dependent DNA helicase PIF1